jgi:NAD(P)H-flavin reductase
MQGEGRVSELHLLDGFPAARIQCSAGLIPAPGQYALAHADGSDAPLATVLFAAGLLADGFVSAPPIPSTWAPGTRLHMRAPLGHGFSLPPSARRIALVSFKCSSRLLLSILAPAFRQEASVTLVSSDIPEDLPLQVEVQPIHALLDTCRWADYMAFDVPREALPELKDILQADRTTMKADAQVLVRAPMPCGALAACGVCTVEARGASLLACEDGPVFGFPQLMGWSSKA